MSDLQTDRLEPTARVPSQQPQPLRPQGQRQRRGPASHEPPEPDDDPGERDAPPHQLDRMA
jgi:hypothetical protein